MASNLVIVESPAKASTIEKYLGSDYQVLASMGHVRDLPASKLGVDVTAHFAPQYVIPPKARKNITALKNALKGKTTVYLATDLDREGEAIAWHVAQALDLDSHKDVVVKRITFDEITKPAILHAVANPRDLDIDLVDAQQARRVLDRLVGYTLSPVLWKKIYRGLSAGRVQSVALRLLVDRERERNAFNPVEYWTLKAMLQSGAGEQFEGNLSQYKGQKIEQLTLTNEAMVSEIVESLKGAAFTVKGLEEKAQKRRPSAPYTTSSLQQDAVNRLGFSAKRVMSIAQKLYERGVITYMRTDSTALSTTAIEGIRTYVTSQLGSQYLPAKPNVYSSKTKNAQEAHEAIRPTDFGRTAEGASNDPAEQRLYDLIWRRAVASQMVEAELSLGAATIAAGEALFRATGQRVTFPGYLAVWGSETRDSQLPTLKEGEIVSLQEILPEQHFTEPPPRFSEATLIKSLEELGIGRPSTYAPTIDTLMQRNYVRAESRRLIPEEVGFTVTDLLVQHFPEIVDTGFTAAMEERLDGVANGETEYAKLLGDFWTPFEKLVTENTEKIPKMTIEETTDALCPICEAPMTVKISRFGKFLACSRFPECKGTRSITETQPTGLLCPVCGRDFVEKKARRGTFLGCAGYPSCTTALWKKEYLPAKITELEGEGIEVPFKQQAIEAFDALGIEAQEPKPRREVAEKKAPVKKKAVKKPAAKKAVAKKAVKTDKSA